MLSFRSTLASITLLAALALAPVALKADSQYVQWGNQMLQSQQYDKALQYFGAAAKADPKDAAAYKGLGYASMGRKDYTNGIKYMDYALQLNPSDSGLRKYLGQTYQGYGNQYYQRGDKVSALAWWQKAVNTDPSNTQLAAYVASLKGAQAQPQAAATAAPKADATTVEESKGINPWVMGGTVALLGVVMLFVF